MNFLCHVNCCNNQGVIPGVTYHKFPKTVAELWFSVHNIPIRKVENVTEMIVCSDHFKLEDYIDMEGRMKLKNGAIPSLYLKISKGDESEPNILQSVLVPNNKEDKSCITLPIKADINQINNLQFCAKSDKLLKVSVLQNNNDPTVVEKFVDKNMDFTDIIAIADETDMLTAINSMHNYSISVNTHVNTNDEQNKLFREEKSAQVSNYLLNEKRLRRTENKVCFKNRHKRKNQKDSIKMLENKKITSQFKNIEGNIHRINEEEMIENIILDHDYTTPDDLSSGENVANNGDAEVHAYNIICSENYVWKLKKQLGLYSRKTRLLRKRLDSLKSVVNVLKKRIL